MVHGPRVHSVHVLLVGGVIIVPLLAADVLPVPPTMMAFVGCRAAATAAAAPAAAARGRGADADADQRQPERRARRGAD